MQQDSKTLWRYPFRLIRMCGNIPLSFFKCFKFLSSDEFSIRCNLFCFFITENWAVAKSYEDRLGKNQDSELNTDARRHLDQRKRKLGTRAVQFAASLRYTTEEASK
jgi:hypothetical protein